MQEYIDSKRNILLWQTPPCRAVLGFENDITRGMEKDCKGKQVWFTRLHETDRGAFLRESDDTLCYAENGVVTPILPRRRFNCAASTMWKTCWPLRRRLGPRAHRGHASGRLDLHRRRAPH